VCRAAQEAGAPHTTNYICHEKPMNFFMVNSCPMNFLLFWGCENTMNLP